MNFFNKGHFEKSDLVATKKDQDIRNAPTIPPQRSTQGKELAGILDQYFNRRRPTQIDLNTFYNDSYNKRMISQEILSTNMNHGQMSNRIYKDELTRKIVRNHNIKVSRPIYQGPA